MVRLFVLLALFLLSCAIPGNMRPAPPPYDVPGAILTLTADVDFGPQERGLIREAAANLERQTHGYLSISVRFSLDFNDDDSLRASVGDDLLLKADHTAPPIAVWDFDHGCGVGGGCLLGLTHHDDRTDTMQVYLIADRLSEFGPRFGNYHDLFVSTTMHEMLHALGLRHTRSGLMSAGFTQGRSPTCLEAPDAKELCRVWGCNVNRVGYCDPNG